MSAGPLRKKLPPARSHPLTTVSTGARRVPGLLSIAEAAECLGISTRTAYEWVHTDAMPGLVRINGRFHIKRAALERFLTDE